MDDLPPFDKMKLYLSSYHLGQEPLRLASLHCRSDHFESALIEKTVEYFVEHKMPFIVLHDGEALLLDTNEPNNRWSLRPDTADAVQF
jgi:hypothetical protein